MRSLRSLAIAAVVAAIAWGAVVFVADDGDREEDEATDRPVHLLDTRSASVEVITVVDPATGDRSELAFEGDRLVVRDGAPIADAELARLADDLFPLLAIRVFAERDPAYGLDEPALRVEISAPSPSTILVGSANFDATGAYVDVDGVTALVLPSVVNTLAAAVGRDPVVDQTEP